MQTKAGDQNIARLMRHFGAFGQHITSGVLFIALFLTGCGDANSFKSYSNYDLKEAYSECKQSDLSPGGAQRCKNIQQECDRRKSESGLRC